MRKIILLISAAWVCICLAGNAFAGTNEIPRMRRVAPKRIPVPMSHDAWDPARVYHQIVLLVEYSDMPFSMSDPVAYYNRLLNEPGFNQGAGPGCAAEYYLDQSGGLFHVQFDIIGPLRIDLVARHTPASQINYGTQEKQMALDLLFATYPDMDYSVYDWDGDGTIEQFLYICTGLCADVGGYSGAIWANTVDWPNGKKTPVGLNIRQHSITGENPSPAAPSGYYGFATLVHEYSHALGLPDVYPTGGMNTGIYSVADAWDIMDGGNYINYGWCPPNYTMHELMYMNWLMPVELTSDTTITGMKPVAEGGEAYLIRHTENEYLLLESRRQKGWDYGIPGEGLTIWHIDFDSTQWLHNNLNSDYLRVSMYFADNMNYKEWEAYYHANESLFGGSPYAMIPQLRTCILSSAAYPWRTDSTDWVNDSLSYDSTPALVMHHLNGQGSTYLGKRITNIQKATDGTISFTLESIPDPEGMETVPSSPLQGGDRGRLILRDGVLLIEKNGRTYTLTGHEIIPTAE